ncbi:MAG: nucleoside/nucleotide kinase family protein [Micrococcales bacterium]|nr:nucleoside/nucleotide kinase family protein [Micrococcales bacterium]
MTAVMTLLGDLDPRRRLLIGIVGAPGSGKSTLAEEAARRLSAKGTPAQVLPMDGYHLSQARLRELGRRERMGAPDTFDTADFVQTLRALRRDRDVAIPLFDREVEEPVPDAGLVPASTRVVLVEGNYLLFETGGWTPVRELLDRVVFLEAPEELRRRRLRARHVLYGKSEAEAIAWIERVDDPNARRIAQTRHRADAVLDPAAPPTNPPIPLSSAQERS